MKIKLSGKEWGTRRGQVVDAEIVTIQFDDMNWTTQNGYEVETLGAPLTETPPPPPTSREWSFGSQPVKRLEIEFDSTTSKKEVGP